VNKEFLKTALGSKETAEQVAERAQRAVPAYKRFLEKHGLKGGEPFDLLPQMDKESYALAYRFAELLADDSEEIFTIFRSSGSSGNSFYWPQLKSASRSSPAALRAFLESAFAVHQKKTLAIVGLPLGGWIGGESFSWALKNMALDTPYPFWVFSPGNHPDEILKMVCKMEPLVDQIVVFIVPSAVAHLHLKAEQLKQSLPSKKLRYIVTGEPFPESSRASLQSRAGVEEDTPFMLSLYGSADTGPLGAESLASVALRKLLYRNNELANSLGIESPIPHFFHFLDPETYLENVGGHICVTRWQGIPLVRYILYDRVALYSWKELKQAILTSEVLDSGDAALVKILSDASDQLPDLVAVTGRADSCLILGGANLMEYMLDAAVKCEELHDILTGLYRARIVYEEDRQYLAFDLEIREGISPEEATNNRVYYALMQSLGRVQPIFLNFWQNIYSAWDSDPEKRILRLNFVPFPGLSQATETTLQQRGIVRS
jgi:phenylacetate-CoA ligase